MLIFVTSTPVITARKEAVENIEIARTNIIAESTEVGKDGEYLGTNLSQVPYI